MFDKLKGKVTIAVDGMSGSGEAPYKKNVQGVIKALKSHPNLPLQVILTGDEELLRTELRHHGYQNDSRITVRQATQVILDSDTDSRGRAKQDSSYHIALNAVVNGEAQAIVSRASTRVFVQLAHYKLKIDKRSPFAFVTIWPTNKRNKRTLMLDTGANVSETPALMLWKAQVAQAMARVLHEGDPATFGFSEPPTVGLLTVGTEANKGDALTQGTYKLLTEAQLPGFLGCIEGDHILDAHSPQYADIVLGRSETCNPILKFARGLLNLLKELVTGLPWYRKYPAYCLLAPLMLLIGIRRLKEINPNESGGGFLVGLKATVVKCNSKTAPRAFATAILMAALSVEKNLVNIIHDIPAPEKPADLSGIALNGTDPASQLAGPPSLNGTSTTGIPAR